MWISWFISVHPAEWQDSSPSMNIFAAQTTLCNWNSVVIQPEVSLSELISHSMSTQPRTQESVVASWFSEQQCPVDMLVLNKFLFVRRWRFPRDISAPWGAATLSSFCYCTLYRVVKRKPHKRVVWNWNVHFVMVRCIFPLSPLLYGGYIWVTEHKILETHSFIYNTSVVLFWYSEFHRRRLKKCCKGMGVLDIVFKTIHKPGCPTSAFPFFIHNGAAVDKALGETNEKSTVQVPNLDPAEGILNW